MGSSCRLLGFLGMLLILLPMAANGDLIDNILGKVCEEVECGKGTCVVNTSYPLGFICECDSGWKRTPNDDDNYTIANSFLPCVLPQCSMNYGCQPAPPPVPEKDYPNNISAFDPCYWVYCGDGKCTRNRTYTHTCECNSGYFNLLNISLFPCYSACTIGSDCSSLGIKVSDSTASNTGSQSGQASAMVGGSGRVHWIVMLLMSTGLALWN